ncbi:MAG: PKD domain-containing protein [Halorientalis sp.]
MSLARRAGVVLLVVAVVVAGVGAAFVAGVFGTPSAGLADRGDWGNVSESRTEVVTTVWVDNPNPVGFAVGDSVDVSYRLFLNGVTLASGDKSGIAIPPGNDTLRLSTDIRNRNLPPWWAAFVRANETVLLRVDASATVGGAVSATVDLPSKKETLLADETPIVTSLSEAASGMEGTYTETVSSERVGERIGLTWLTLLSTRYVTGRDSNVTVGYEVREGWAEWGPVTDETTTVYFHFRIHNPGDVPVPAAPSTLGVDVELNDVELFSATANDTSLRNPSAFTDSDVFGGRVLEPGETEAAVYAVEMENERIDEWFRSHVRRGEHTDVRVEGKLVFSLRDLAFAVPAESPVAYTCDLQTGMLVDGQNTSTNCGQVASLRIVGGADTASDGSSDGGTGNGTESGGGPDGDGTTDATGDGPEPPTAVAEATPSSGQVPLEVRFDASGSTDPDGDIRRYVWRFGNGTIPAEGETVTHTFRTAGQYRVELVAIDSRGNRDSTTVTVTVESRLG